MVDYEVTVFTADLAASTTFNNVFIKLVGTDGESERKWLISFKGAASFMRAAVRPTFSFPTCRACFIDRAFMSLEFRESHGLRKLFDLWQQNMQMFLYLIVQQIVKLNDELVRFTLS